MTAGKEKNLSLIDRIKHFGIELKHNISYSEAFSLIELMISLIAISCITAAFAPVVTKKLKATNLKVSVGGIKTRCEAFGGLDPNGKMYCKACVNTGCISCSKTCSVNQAKDDANCNCVACTDVGGSQCKRCNLAECTKCNTGYGMNSSGDCEACGAGKASNGEEACMNCEKGKYSSGTANTKCEICADGTYQDTEGQSSCKTCESKTDKCVACNKTSGVCERCQLGFYLENGACKECLPGTMCSNGISQEVCPQGYYQSSPGQSSCIACPVGKYQANTGQTWCSSCDAGYYQPYTAQVGRSACTKCPTGYWQDTPASQWCNPCPAGWYLNATTSTKNDCKPCPAGQVTTAAGTATCTPCSPGAIRNPGTISNVGYSTGGTECRACPTAWHSNSTATECLIDDCDPGFYLSNNVCTACAKGYYAATRDVRYSCTQCAEHTYTSGTGATSCATCASYTYSYSYVTGSYSWRDCRTDQYSSDYCWSNTSTSYGTSWTTKWAC